MAQGEKLKTCPACELKTHHRFCPVCMVDGEPLALTGDRLADEVQSKIAAGEMVDLDTMFAPKNAAPQQGEFVPVPRG